MTIGLRSGALALAGAALALAGPAPAGARRAVPRDRLIVPGSSVANVGLGEAAGAVIETLGRPLKEATPGGTQWLYGPLDVWMDSTELNVLELIVAPVFGATRAQAAAFETSSGVHVGSSVSAVAKAYPAARCNAHDRGCFLGANGRETWFRVARGTRFSRGATISAIVIEQ
ncbi:MAG TPA: hypothetical protein VL977_08030 [Solirubrobacteraceae bacterium]|nr:hypothetical protein [Solirubrobacteraceae bacterium]